MFAIIFLKTCGVMMIKEGMGEKIILSPHPQFMGVYGVALIGLENS